MTGEAGPVPDDVRQAVAQAIHGAACGCHAEDVADSFPNPADAVVSASYGDQADAVLSVPAVAEVFARDAKVAEIVGDFPYGATSSQMVALAEEVLDVHRWTAP